MLCTRLTPKPSFMAEVLKTNSPNRAVGAGRKLVRRAAFLWLGR